MPKEINHNVNTENENDDQPLSFKQLFKQREPESTFILFIVPVLLTLWVYYGKQQDFDQLFKGFHGRWNQDFYSTIYEYMTAFLLMFWIPFFLVKMVFKYKLRNFGFQLGDKKYGFKFVLITIPFIIWAAYVGTSNASIQAEYPLARSIMGHWYLFAIIQMFYLFYYVGWEFFFRGFMLFGLEKRFGPLAAILIQTIPSAIVHIGKPVSESFGAILGGLVFGYLAIRTRSILYPFILHALLGISTDYFVILRLT